MFLDHDDLWETDALDVLVGALEVHPVAVAASGLSRVIDERDQWVEPGELETWGRHRLGISGHRLVPWSPRDPTTLDVLAYQNYICTPGQVLIRRAAFATIGGFDPACSPCDDRDMWLRLSLLGEITFVDRVVLNWRKHSGNQSQHREVMREKQFYVRRKLLSTPNLSQQQVRVIRLAHRFLGRHSCSLRMGWAKQMLRHGEFTFAAEELARALTDYLAGMRGMPVPAPTLRPTVKQLYNSARTTPSDINEHLGVLFHLAKRCQHVTEFGTRTGTSTTALLAAHPRVLVSYDRVCLPEVSFLKLAADRSRRTRFTFYQANVLSVEIEETDLLFIDTWHVYEQLSQELALHSPKVRRYLVFHDTTTFGEHGESPGHRGLWPAIEEFLNDNQQWRLIARLTNNNGLTILVRERMLPRESVVCSA